MKSTVMYDNKNKGKPGMTFTSSREEMKPYHLGTGSPNAQLQIGGN